MNINIDEVEDVEEFNEEEEVIIEYEDDIDDSYFEEEFGVYEEPPIDMTDEVIIKNYRVPIPNKTISEPVFGHFIVLREPKKERRDVFELHQWNNYATKIEMKMSEPKPISKPVFIPPVTPVEKNEYMKEEIVKPVKKISKEEVREQKKRELEMSKKTLELLTEKARKGELKSGQYCFFEKDEYETMMSLKYDIIPRLERELR